MAVTIAATRWAFYLLVPWHRLPYFSKYRGGIGTTDGISYDEVRQHKGYSIEQYSCPGLPANPTADDLDSAVKVVAPDLAANAWVKLPKGAATPATPVAPKQESSV